MPLCDRLYGDGILHPHAKDKSTRRVYDHVTGGERIHNDWEFTEFAPELAGGPLAEAWEEFRELPGEVCRFRIVSMAPGVTYPFHCDEVIRYHVALQTAPECLFFECPGKEFDLDNMTTLHIPVDNHIWALNGKDKLHTAINGSLRVHRIHLIVSSVLTSD